jgi:hypothetical protein
LPLPPHRLSSLDEQVQRFLRSSECWIERTRPQVRQINLRPYVRAIHLREDAVELDLWVGPYGTARPEEVLQQLGLADVLEQGAILHRTRLELLDESQEPASRPAFLQERGQPSKSSHPAAGQRDHGEAQSLIPGPLSFDS